MDYHVVIDEAKSKDNKEKKEKMRLIYDEDIPERIYVKIKSGDLYYGTWVETSELKRAISQIEKLKAMSTTGRIDNTTEREIDLSE